MKQKEGNEILSFVGTCMYACTNMYLVVFGKLKVRLSFLWIEKKINEGN